MGYMTMAALSEDNDIMRRVTACAASLGVDNPFDWANRNQWRLSAQSEWVARYEASTSERPGADETAITDGDILAAVQALLAAEAAEQPDPVE